MARTGESYQQAHARLLELRPPRPVPAAPRAAEQDVDLLSIRYFGVPSALATFEIGGRLAVLVLSNPHLPVPFPHNPLFALRSPRAVH